MVQGVPGDPECHRGGGENTWKSGWKGREGRALRVLIFGGKLEVSSHAGRGVFVWGEGRLRAFLVEWTESLRKGSEQMLWV